jgi:hypothetical protein
MFVNAKIVLAAALVLGTVSAVLADDAQGTRAELLAQIQNHAADARTSFGYITSSTRRADVSHKRNHDR